MDGKTVPSEVDPAVTEGGRPSSALATPVPRLWLGDQRRWASWLTVGSPLFLAGLALIAVLNWGPLDQYIAFIDLFPFTELNPSKWLPATLSVWNTAWVGGGDIHYGSGYLLLSALEWPAITLGVPSPIVERGSYALLFIGMALAAYALPRTLGITSRPLPRLLGSIAYVFGLGHAMTTPSSLVDTSFLLAPLVPIIYARILRDSGWTVLRSTVLLVLAAQLLAYVFNNPPQTVITLAQIIPICLYLLVQEWQRPRVVVKTIGVSVVTLLASLWWIVPGYITTFNTSVQLVATTDVASWSWTHVRASLLNIWRFTSSWAWPHPEYLPWTSFFQPAALQIVLLWPLAALGSALLLGSRGRTKLPAAALFWGGMATLAAFLSKGLHPPLTTVNLWMYEHVPGFFLFREPTDKFSGPLALASAMLLVLVLARIQGGHARPPVRAATIVAVAAIVGAIAVPFVDGQITANSPARMGLMRVAIPSYWHAMAGYVNGLPTSGGIAILPNDDFYEMFYDWGFYGVDALPEVIFDRPVFYLNDTPNFYSTAAGPLDRQEEALVKELHEGRTNDVPALLGSQGVRYVLLRRDVRWDISGRNTISPLRLVAQLQQTQGITPLQTFGQLDLYEIEPALVRDQVYAVAAQRVVTRPQANISAIAAAARVGTAIATASPSTCSRSPASPEATPITVTTIARALNGYTIRVTGMRGPTLLILNQTYSPDWKAATLDGEACSGTPSHVVVNGFANGWWINGSGTAEIQLTFEPQRHVKSAYVVTAVTMVSLLVALLAALLYGIYHRNRRDDSHATTTHSDEDHPEELPRQ